MTAIPWFRAATSLLLAVFAVALLMGCGNNIPPLITLTLDPSNPQVLHVNQTFTITATAHNYTSSSDLNVAWTTTCTGGSCGTIEPNFTNQGQSVTYTAPSTPPSSQVIITADLQAGHTAPSPTLAVTVLP